MNRFDFDTGSELQKPNMETDQKEQTPKIEKDDWNTKDLVEESVNKPADETMREVLRGDETSGDADERDVAGSADKNDTPQGREENKNH